jgi:hypothetical protein
MSLPGQMFDSMLNPAKGWPHQAALDFQAKISPNVQYDMVAGQVAHINLAGELEPGVQLYQMGLFMFQGQNDYDVNAQRNNQWTPISPSGRVMCLVASGAYELETTAFDTTQTYETNQPLNAPIGNSVGSAGVSGFLTNVAPGTIYGGSMKSIVGIVSRGAFTNAYGVPVLAFWCVYVPGTI